MKKYLYLAVLMLIGASSLNAASPKKKAKEMTPEAKGVASINHATAEAHVEFLACDELEGREAGWKGGRIAGNYIISCLKQMGLQPLFEDGYVQPFEACHAERQKRGQRWEVHPDSIAKLQQGIHQSLDLRNILCKIEGKNPNEIVIIGDFSGLYAQLRQDGIDECRFAYPRISRKQCHLSFQILFDFVDTHFVQG